MGAGRQEHDLAIGAVGARRVDPVRASHAWIQGSTLPVTTAQKAPSSAALPPILPLSLCYNLASTDEESYWCSV
jgi:hypothetical protein